MKIKTSNLTGAALDWAVASAAGYLTGGHFHYRECRRVELQGRELIDWASTNVCDDYCTTWAPSTDWAQGGPIIDQEGISFFRCEDEYGVDSRGYTTSRRIPVYGAVIGEYFGTDQQRNSYGESWGEIYYIGYELVTLGPIPLIAAMRCYVASKLGDEVDVPEELL